KNESDRLLIVNFWIDLPITITPYYEILFTIQIFIIMYVCISYLCIDNFLCMINLHTATQFRILQYRLSNVCGANERSDKISKKTPSNSDECYAKFKNCIQQHQALIEYCNKLQEVFGIFVLAQVLLFSLLMCLDGYLVMVSRYYKIQRNIIVFLFSDQNTSTALFIRYFVYRIKSVYSFLKIGNV
ncbi:Odorant receptor Or2, partial [Habropoda laboriosa]